MLTYLLCYVDDNQELFNEYESKEKCRLPGSDYSDTNRLVRKRSTRKRLFDGLAIDMDAQNLEKTSDFGEYPSNNR